MTHPLTSEQRRAFLSGPDPGRYYAAASIEEARMRIVRAVARSEGPVLVVGAVGVGKTMLLATVAQQFEPRMSVVTLPGAQLCTRRALLQMILGGLHLPYRHMDEGELRLSITEYLRGAAAGAPTRPRRMLLLVDEADALPTRLLEELRVLTNLVAGGVPLVSLVLAGGPVLEERFADPQLDMFSQRVAARCYLAPFTRDETSQYVRSQVSAVGVKPEKWFDHEALAAVHAATGGVPRLVNQLGDQLVWLIEETGCQPLDAALVQQAWSDLQQLPAPWNTDAHSSLSSAQSGSVGFAAIDTGDEASVIEFGDLDDAAPQARAATEGGQRGLAAPSDAPVGRGPQRCAPHDPAPHELPDDGDRAAELFHASHGVPMPRSSALDGALDGALDDDLPASIPFASARRDADLGQYAAAIDATELLVDQLDEFEELELKREPVRPADAPSGIALAAPARTGTAASSPLGPVARDPAASLPTIPARPGTGPAARTPAPPQRAADPFEESFDEEEVLVDPYAEFESHMLRAARQVLNRVDRTFAAELARCEMRKSGVAPTLATATADAASAAAATPAMAKPAAASAVRSAATRPLTLPPGEPAPLIVVEGDDRPAAAIVPGKQLRRLFSTLEQAAPRARRG